MNLTEKYRPDDLSKVIGQPHLTGPNGILARLLATNLKSMIFYGPPGIGKSTVARIIAAKSNMIHYEFNATKVSLKEIRDCIEKAAHCSQFPCLVYLDEIQYFNKKQQQSLLPYIEDGTIILIGATTENPYYCCYDALLSRCQPVKFKQVSATTILEHLHDTICPAENRTNIEPQALMAIANRSAGDVRRAVNQLDFILTQFDDPNVTITLKDVNDTFPEENMGTFDTDGDTHYALISALQKSIRGSDPNAAVFYLARLLEGGDILSPCRRLLVIANEDIGLANPTALYAVYACVETAKQLGMPEAAKPLTNAVLLLATSPKTNTSETTYFPAVEDIKNRFGTEVPKHLRHACSPDYLYPHDYPNHWCPQQYLPDDIKDRQYYKAGDNQMEQNAKAYWNYIKGYPEW